MSATSGGGTRCSSHVMVCFFPSLAEADVGLFLAALVSCCFLSSPCFTFSALTLIRAVFRFSGQIALRPLCVDRDHDPQRRRARL